MAFWRTLLAALVVASVVAMVASQEEEDKVPEVPETTAAPEVPEEPEVTTAKVEPQSANAVPENHGETVVLQLPVLLACMVLGPMINH